MINRYFKGEVPYPSPGASKTAGDGAIAEAARKTIREFGVLFDQFQFSRALETAWGLIAAVDKYIVENEPWTLGEKQDDESRARLATVLYTSAEALRVATALAHPVMPDATAKIWAQMGLGDIKKLALADLAWGQLPFGTKLGEVSPVFPRADKSAIERMQQMEDQQRGPAVEEPKEPAAAPAHHEACRGHTFASSRSRRWEDYHRRLREDRVARRHGEGGRAGAKGRQTLAAGNRYWYRSTAGSGRDRRGICSRDSRWPQSCDRCQPGSAQAAWAGVEWNDRGRVT